MDLFRRHRLWSSSLGMVILIACVDYVSAKDKIRLTEISALTFYAGRQTTGRRSTPVPQMQCVGGSAGCGQLTPQVVQCYNKGNDGVDVQWECKADLDNSVKLGAIEVVCEGYDYANDPYILRGSCGLEYQLNRNTGYGGGGSAGQSTWQQSSKNRGFMMSDFLIVAVVAIIIYALYKTCLNTPQYSTTNSEHPDSRPGGYGGYPSAPPPPYSTGFGGFSSPDSSGADCHSSQYRSGRQGGGGGMGSTNFWTGAATGGLMGYLFGARNQGGYGSARHHGYTSERSSNWGSGGSSGGFSSGGTSSSTSFGGTRRR